MTTPEGPTTELGPPTDVSVGPEDLDAPEGQDETPTASAAQYEEGDAEGGTGGLDAGGAG